MKNMAYGTSPQLALPPARCNAYGESFRVNLYLFRCVKVPVLGRSNREACNAIISFGGISFHACLRHASSFADACRKTAAVPRMPYWVITFPRLEKISLHKFLKKLGKVKSFRHLDEETGLELGFC
jgi:hypothetical protein